MAGHSLHLWWRILIQCSIGLVIFNIQSGSKACIGICTLGSKQIPLREQCPDRRFCHNGLWEDSVGIQMSNGKPWKDYKEGKAAGSNDGMF